MNDDEILARLKSLLERFQQLGLQQINAFKALNPGMIRRGVINGREVGEINGVLMPINDLIRRISVQEDVFLANFLQGFWDYYQLNISNIQSPARQGIDRTLMELCYQKLLPITHMTEAEKKRILLINNICDIGLILAKPSERDRDKVATYIDDYDFWVAELAREADRNKFEELKRRGYPTHAYADAKHKLWPSFYQAYNDNSEDLVFPWAGNNIPQARDNFLRFYQMQHDFVHGSHLSVIIALRDESTKSHLMNSFIVSTQAGYQFLATTNKYLIVERPVDIDSVLDEAGEILQLLMERFSHLAET